MKYRSLAHSGICVSEVGFGVWTLSTGWWGKIDPPEAVRLLRQAKERGINFFDTADTYGNGLGETLLADAFAGCWDEIVVSTKFGYNFYDYGDKRTGQQEIPQDFSPSYIRKACEESLKRLETDRVDLYQIHNPKMDAVLRDDLYTELEKLRAEGKIRLWGASMGPAIGWLEEGTKIIRERKPGAMQMIYNLLEQDPGRDFFAEGRETGTHFLIRVPHSSGLLEGKYTKDTTFDEKDHRSHRKREWLIHGLRKLEKLEFLTAGKNRTIGQAALKFILAEPLVTSVFPNIYSEAQLEEFSETSNVEDLTREDIDRVNDLYDHGFYLEDVGAPLRGRPIEPEGRAQRPAPTVK